MVKITSVKPQDDYKLFLTFSNGKKGVFDARPYLDKGSIFIPLQDPTLFKSVHIADATIEWTTGADLCPDCVYAETKFI